MGQVLPLKDNKVFLSITTISFDILFWKVWLLCYGLRILLTNDEEQLSPALMAK